MPASLRLVYIGSPHGGWSLFRVDRTDGRRMRLPSTRLIENIWAGVSKEKIHVASTLTHVGMPSKIPTRVRRAFAHSLSKEMKIR